MHKRDKLNSPPYPVGVFDNTGTSFRARTRGGSLSADGVVLSRVRSVHVSVARVRSAHVSVARTSVRAQRLVHSVWSLKKCVPVLSSVAERKCYAFPVRISTFLSAA